jgi:hypothetical protein
MALAVAKRLNALAFLLGSAKREAESKAGRF